MNSDHVNFGSSLYLGLRHASRELPPWRQLTTGGPAILGPTPGATEVEARLRQLLGVEATFTTASTLHALADIRAIHGDHRVVLDQFAYPIADLVSGTGPARFRHNTPGALQRCVEPLKEPALVIVDGWCTVCGRPAPIGEYARIVRRHGGVLVIDDTQAWGLIGRGTRPHHPIAPDGSGSVVAHRLSGHPTIVTVASAAKAYGVPIAVVAGPARVVDRLRFDGPTRTHSSQPSAAHLAALAHALDVDGRYGADLRHRLDGLTRRLVASLQAIPVRVRSGGFPVVGIELAGGADVHRVRELLRRSGVHALVVRGHRRPLLTFVVRSDHRAADIDRASRSVRDLLHAADDGRHRSAPVVVGTRSTGRRPDVGRMRTT